MNDKLSNWRWAVGSLLLGGALAAGIWGLTTGTVMADRDRGEYEEHHDYSGRSTVKPLPLYQEECGSCHLAYPPGLLNADKWRQIMTSLEDHFGENAELDSTTRNELERYLVGHAADNSGYGERRYLRNQSSNPSLRISEQYFFVHEHDEIPRRIVADNEQVGSFSRCEACHREAQQGDFDEHRVNIPGFGRWDD